MDEQQFLAELAAAGFPKPVLVERDANASLDSHTHPFEARALILSGEITIDAGGQRHCYRPGDVFRLGAGEPHSERYGPAGVTYLAGRK